jgi:DNA polymerase-1
MQIVSDTVFIYDAYKELVYDRQKVIKKFGVPPERVGEYLALTGDSIDNVPGVPGIGPKRAVEILNKYKDFETAVAQDKRIATYREQALLSKKLVQLECNVPLNIKPEDIIIRKPNLDKLMPLLLDLELHSYIKSLSKGTSSDIEIKEIKDINKTKFGEKIGLAAKDKDEIFICPNKDTVYAVHLNNAKDVLCNSNITKVGYNLKELAKTVNITAPLFDIGVASWLIDPNKRKYELEDIVLHNLHTYKEITPAASAQCSFQLYKVLQEKLEEQQEAELYRQIEEPLIHVLAHMEQRGVEINISYFTDLRKEFDKEISQIEKKIYKLAGRTFNINSPKQLAKILFEDLQLQPTKKGKKHYSTSVDVLHQLSHRHPLPQEVLRYREYAKIASTYIEPLIAVARDSRIHTTFNQTGTATGRLSSSNPNIQNIPIRTELGRKIRKGFTTRKGCLLISADYSQVELRLLAHISNDKNLIQAFNQNKDIHRHTASLVFHISEDEIDENNRRMAKVVNYGLIYGMSDYGLAQGLDIPQEQAIQFIQSYYNLYSSVEKWREQAIISAEEKGYTETLFGRKRPLPDIHSNNYAVREFSKRAAINTPIQGTAADLIKLAMIQVEKKLSKVKFKSGLLLSIHDELLFEIEAERINEAKEIIKDSMENVIKLDVPLEVSIGIGKTWDEAH